MKKGNIFTQVNMTRPEGNTFDLSHAKKLSCNAGQLVPVLNMEVLPGDKFNIQTAQMVRFAPLVAPLMHQVSVHTHFFFVPNRLVWPNWENFITGGEDGADTSVHPYVDIDISDSTSFPTGCNADYMGLPVGTGTSGTTQPFNAIPVAAIAKIYNEYFRDQNLTSPIPDELVDGDNTTNFEPPLQATPIKRAWYHDYFTSCLPWTQKGPQATIPLGSTAPLTFNPGGSVADTVWNADGTTWPATGDTKLDGGVSPYRAFNSSTGEPINIDVSRTHEVDLTSATAATIIDLRNAFKLQEWLEKNARGGSRYIESILSHFGVRSSDARLQRPEFLGGSSQPVTFSEVLQTSSTDATTPQGNMAGHGVSVGQSKGINYRSEEHGWIIGFMSIMPKPEYFQGVHKSWIRFDKFDYAWPEFAHIGDEAVLNGELYHSNTPATDADTFGYISRYASYKYMPSTVHGEFRDTLDFWHWARKFSTTPTLNTEFIECVPRTDIFANESGEQLYVQLYHQIRCYRLLPYFGNPKM
jgi:hypothetical protein